QPRAWVELSTLFFVGYYACLTKQLVATDTREAIRAEERFRQEQAAMLTVDISITPSGPSIRLQNIGRTEAKAISVRTYEWIYEGNTSKTFGQFAKPWS